MLVCVEDHDGPTFMYDAAAKEDRMSLKNSTRLSELAAAARHDQHWGCPTLKEGQQVQTLHISRVNECHWKKCL